MAKTIEDVQGLAAQLAEAAKLVHGGSERLLREIPDGEDEAHTEGVRAGIELARDYLRSAGIFLAESAIVTPEEARRRRERLDQDKAKREQFVAELEQLRQRFEGWFVDEGDP